MGLPKESALERTYDAISGDVSKRLKMDNSSMEIEEEEKITNAETAWQ